MSDLQHLLKVSIKSINIKQETLAKLPLIPYLYHLLISHIQSLIFI